MSAKPNTAAPKTTPVRRCSSSPAIRGRENFSIQRMRFSRARLNFGPDRPFSSRSLNRSGIHTSVRPTTSSNASSMVRISSTWLTAPVGSGRAGSAISTTNRMAKLRGPKVSTRSPIVFFRSLCSHSSSCTLTFCSSCSSPASPDMPSSMAP